MKKLILFLPIIILIFGAAAQKKDSIPKVEDFKYLVRRDSFLTGNIGDVAIVKTSPESSLEFIDTRITDTEDVSVEDLINNKTVHLLLEYKKECYNDSTVWLGVYDWVYPSNVNTVTDNMIDSSKNIISRKTPTFEDFLNWIEEKQNKTK